MLQTSAGKIQNSEIFTQKLIELNADKFMLIGKSEKLGKDM
jgi:hypothetical protein